MLPTSPVLTDFNAPSHIAQALPPEALPLLTAAASRWLQAAGWATLAFALTAWLTGRLIGWLAAHQLGKAIREDGPDHSAKAGTPTMGGLALLAVVGLLGLILAFLAVRTGTEWTATASPSESNDLANAASVLITQGYGVLVALAAALLFGIVGLLDDWAGLARKGRAREMGVGFGARQMFAMQLVVGLIVVAGINVLVGPLTPALSLFIAVAAVVGTVNGVNFSDGLDELAASLCVWAFAGLGVILSTAASSGERQLFLLKGFIGGPPPLATLAWIIAGACLGFWVHNRHPAKVFMGNVCSMALGGLLSTIAILGLAPGSASPLQWAPILAILAAVFAAEVVSDILQVGYFKMTGGKRLFRMAPLHHHFEKGGMPETDVVRGFRFAGFLAALAAVALAVVSYGR